MSDAITMSQKQIEDTARRLVANKPRIGQGLRRKGSLLIGDTRPVSHVLRALDCRWIPNRCGWDAGTNEKAKHITLAFQRIMFERAGRLDLTG